MKKDMKRITAVKSCFLALLAGFLLAGCFGKTHVIRLGAAPQGGLYYEFGVTFANQLRQDNMVLDVRITSGSVENLQLLKEGRLQAGIAQSDVLYADAEENRKNPVYSAIAPLYSEAVHIVVRSESDIHSVQDLRGKIVAIGDETSGTCVNALDVLNACGLTDRDMTFMYNNYDLASQDLMDKRIDAFFMTAGTPNNVIGDIARNEGIRLISLEPEIIEKLCASMPCYSAFTIGKDTYARMEEDTVTVCVTSVLLVRNDLSEDAVYTLTKRLSESQDVLSQRLRIRLLRDAGGILSSISLPVHPGAAGYLREQK